MTKKPAQLEDGYTQIANGILEALARISIDSEARRVFDFIMRRTYGFHKKHDIISLGQIAAGTGITRTNIPRNVKKLVEMKLITVKQTIGNTRSYGINKNVSEWSRPSGVVSPVITPPQVVSPVITGVVSPMITGGSITCDTHKKYILKKEEKILSAARKSPEKNKPPAPKKKEIEILSEFILEKLKIPMSDKGETEKLLKAFGLQYMKDAVERMALYFQECKAHGWKNFIIGKHWRNLYQKLEYFSDNENFYKKLEATKRSNDERRGPASGNNIKGACFISPEFRGTGTDNPDYTAADLHRETGETFESYAEADKALQAGDRTLFDALCKRVDKWKKAHGLK